MFSFLIILFSINSPSDYSIDEKDPHSGIQFSIGENKKYDIELLNQSSSSNITIKNILFNDDIVTDSGFFNKIIGDFSNNILVAGCKILELDDISRGAPIYAIYNLNTGNYELFDDTSVEVQAVVAEVAVPAAEAFRADFLN